MKIVTCQNMRAEGSRKVKCGRVLAVLTDLQVDIIKVDQEKPIFRCPRCDSEDRWVSISVGDNGPVFEVIDKPDLSRVESVEFVDYNRCEQVGYYSDGGK